TRSDRDWSSDVCSSDLSRDGGCDRIRSALSVTVFAGRFWRPRRQAAEKPLRDELLSIERLEERALALAASLTVDPNPRHRARNRSEERRVGKEWRTGWA